MRNTIKHKGYVGSIEYFNEDNIFFRKIEGINSLITFEADTMSDLEQSFQDSVEDYIKFRN